MSQTRDWSQAYILIHRQGATVEEMTVEVNRAKMNLEKVETDLRNMTTLNKVSIIYPRRLG